MPVPASIIPPAPTSSSFIEAGAGAASPAFSALSMSSAGPAIPAAPTSAATCRYSASSSRSAAMPASWFLPPLPFFARSSSLSPPIRSWIYFSMAARCLFPKTPSPAPPASAPEEDGSAPPPKVPFSRCPRSPPPLAPAVSSLPSSSSPFTSSASSFLAAIRRFLIPDGWDRIRLFLSFRFFFVAIMRSRVDPSSSSLLSSSVFTAGLLAAPSSSSSSFLTAATSDASGPSDDSSGTSCAGGASPSCASIESERFFRITRALAFRALSLFLGLLNMAFIGSIRGRDPYGLGAWTIGASGQSAVVFVCPSVRYLTVE